MRLYDNAETMYPVHCAHSGVSSAMTLTWLTCPIMLSLLISVNISNVRLLLFGSYATDHARNLPTQRWHISVLLTILYSVTKN